MSRKPRGQVAVILAIALPALIGAIALTTDVAVLYMNWSALQRSADAAVLAGANYLPDDVADAKNTATQYVKNNGVLASEIVGTPTISADSLSITVNLSRTVPYIIAKSLGLTTGIVKVSATAALRNLPLARSLVPIGLGCPPGNCGYNNKQTYHLKASQVGNGNWGPLALGGSGANNYRQNLDFGYTGAMKAGDTVATETGNITGPTGQAIGDRLSFGASLDPGMTADTAPAYDPRFVVVPLVDFGSANGKSSVVVQGFAEMWLIGISNNNSTIDAEFLQVVQTAPIANPGPTTTPVLIR
jgi:hypothetical protein